MCAYLKLKDKEIDFTVEKLNTLGRFAAFKVGAPFHMFNKLNDENYWPPNVEIRRFNYWPQKKRNSDTGNESPEVNTTRNSNFLA